VKRNNLQFLAKSIQEINETGMRSTGQCFHRGNLSNEKKNMKGNLALLKHIYAKSFMKYDHKVMSRIKEQFFIIYGELEIFKKKVATLNNFFSRDAFIESGMELNFYL